MKIKLTHLPFYNAAISLIFTLVLVVIVFELTVKEQLVSQQLETETAHVRSQIYQMENFINNEQATELRNLIANLTALPIYQDILVIREDWQVLGSSQVRHENLHLVDVAPELVAYVTQVVDQGFTSKEIVDGNHLLYRIPDPADFNKNKAFISVTLDLSKISDNAKLVLTNDLIVFSFATVFMALVLYLSTIKVLKKRLRRIEESLIDFTQGNRVQRLSQRHTSDFKNLEKTINKMLDELDSEQRSLVEEKDFSNILLNSISDGLVTINEMGKIIVVNRSAVAIFGYDYEEELLNQDIVRLVPSEYRSAHQKKFFSGHSHNTSGILNKLREVEGIKKDGTRVPISITIVQNSRKGKVFFTAFINDLTESNNYKRSMEKIAFFDGLTELLNVNGLKRKLSKQPLSGYLALIELNDLKVINEGYGYEFGDKLVTQFGQSLKEMQHNKCTIAAATGGRFLIHTQLPPSDFTAKLNSFRHKVTYIFDVPFKLDLKCSYIRLNNESSFDVQLRFCRIALRNEASASPDQFVEVDVDWINRRAYQSRLQQRLSNAISNEQLFFHFQPKFSSFSKKIVAAEALIRWKANDEFIPPAKFIPIAENSHLMPHIDQYVISLACRSIRHWLDQGLDVVPIAINLSSKYLFLDTTINYIFEKVGEYSVPPELLEIEVTEYGLINDFEKTAENMQRLQNSGLKLAIDDYGTGHSNLETVAALPIQNLKIDQAFIKRALGSDKSKAILENIVDLAHALKIELTAEGVETQEQFDYMRSLHCHYIQGYLLSKPLEESDFLEKLREQNALVSTG